MNITFNWLEPIKNSRAVGYLANELNNKLEDNKFIDCLYTLCHLHYKMTIEQGKYQLEILNILSSIKRTIIYKNMQDDIHRTMQCIPELEARLRIREGMIIRGEEIIEEIGDPSLTDGIRSDMENEHANDKNKLKDSMEKIRISEMITRKFDQLARIPNEK